MGQWVNTAKRFLSSNFEGKKVAVFVCSRRGGEPDLHVYAFENYVEKVIKKKLKIDPIAYEAFGGRKPLKDGNFYDNRDWNKIRDWAYLLGKNFSS